MLLQDAGADFLRHIRHERGLSETTCVCYISWIRHFQRWLEGNGYPRADLTVFCLPTLRRYQYALSAKGYRPRTLRSALQPLRALGDFLADCGALPENPARALVKPKLDAARRLLCTDEELTDILAAAERYPDRRKRALARAMISVLVYCGLRAQELTDLKVGDFSAGAKTLLVRCGKGGKSGVLYPPSACVDALREWLAVRGDCTHDWMWAQNRGRRLSDDGLRRLWEEVKTVAGYEDAPHLKFHSVRHRMACRMHEKGATINQVSAALRHGSTQTTLVYLHLTEEQARDMATLADLKPAGVASGTPAPQSNKNERAAQRLTRPRLMRRSVT